MTNRGKQFERSAICSEKTRHRGEKLKRGDIYFINRKSHPNTGSEQQSGRPAIIVSNNVGNCCSQVLEVVYMTTKYKPSLPTHVEINSVLNPSTALCEQINTISKARLGRYIGRVSKEELSGIDNALLISLGLLRARGNKKRGG